MNYMKLTLLSLFSMMYGAQAQTIHFDGKEFKFSHVKASVVKLDGEEVLRIERDLESLPFDPEKLGESVDEPTFLKLNDLDIENGIVEVKVLSRLLPNAPAFARGFIGLAFRINEDNSAFESIYLRPTNGRAEDQFRRNHTIQYYAYPDYKFDRLRAESKGEYETYADIGLDEWITVRIEFNGKSAKLFLDDQKSPAFLVNELLSSAKSGSVGLWVDIGTEGFFKDLKIIQ
ncbi:hypothetical protein SAMN03080617_01453 [Algoriphagus alkaliphilus]|uniref:3-keto-disaccharide hydrolase domain-containing protein n=1 Tax=Algoriphagus alkaliphilus TaxID=279824 RepID=A0A1G5X0K5_9BACT|nr:hypothetical protein [Algoriphagus alkaliphilus]SDA63624.1 hypothetical protein SAMN03080617_01453 [Algoriphagus alkaliphilus]